MPSRRRAYARHPGFRNSLPPPKGPLYWYAMDASYGSVLGGVKVGLKGLRHPHHHFGKFLYQAFYYLGSFWYVAD